MDQASATQGEARRSAHLGAPLDGSDGLGLASPDPRARGAAAGSALAPSAPGPDAEEALVRRAYRDDLTDLPNRSYLRHAVDVLVGEGGASFALAFLDLDGFKHINDYYGHAVGDQILVKVARRLSAALPYTSLLSRVGGDEFVILIQGQEDVLALAERLLARLKEPMLADGHEVFVSASVGISVFPDHGRDLETLRRSADLAMYRVKRGRKGAVAMFDDAMRSAADGRLEVEQRLRLAIRDRRFFCAYQPKVDIRTGRTAGLEVLLRWRDEAGDIQPPGGFIELAVELGMIDDITRMVIDETVSAIDDIDAAFGTGTSISFNVAAKQAGDAKFMTDLIGNLASTGLAERFMLEVTEEAFFDKSVLQETVLPMLRRIGTKLSIDDFGVGYSSLAALAALTADELKVDRSFITDVHRRPRSQVVLRAIESLGRALDMSVVAEGVETAEELAFLLDGTGIGQAQGYYFSKPVPLSSFASTRTLYAGARSTANGRRAAPTRGQARRGSP